MRIDTNYARLFAPVTQDPFAAGSVSDCKPQGSERHRRRQPPERRSATKHIPPARPRAPASKRSDSIPGRVHVRLCVRVLTVKLVYAARDAKDKTRVRFVRELRRYFIASVIARVRTSLPLFYAESHTRTHVHATHSVASGVSVTAR